MLSKDQILDKLPYQKPFLFVDKIDQISLDMVEGSYTLKEDEYFYQGHFKDNPVTPGVILTEIMAQIGVVCLGMFLLSLEDVAYDSNEIGVAMNNTAIDFLKPVYPGESVIVKSTKEYFRFNKLKCKVVMFNSKNELVAKGFISGMMKFNTIK